MLHGKIIVSDGSIPTVTSTSVDTSPPSISISKQNVDFNKNDQLDEGEKLVITYGANDESGVKSIKILMDGNLIELHNNEGIYSVTTDSLSIGSHTIAVEAIDSKGNKKSEEITINAARAGQFEIQPGESIRSVSVRMRADKAGEYQLDAEVYHQFETGERSPTRYETLNIVVKPKPIQTSIPKAQGFEAILACIGIFLVLAFRRR